MFARHRFDAAKEIVGAATRGSTLVSCLLFGFIALCMLAGIVGVVLATIFYSLGPGFLGAILVGVMLVSAIPWIVHLFRTAARVRSALEQVRCPQCHGTTGLSTDDSNVYMLICDPCRVLWITGVAAPGSDSHHHHHHP